MQHVTETKYFFPEYSSDSAFYHVIDLVNKKDFCSFHIRIQKYNFFVTLHLFFQERLKKYCTVGQFSLFFWFLRYCLIYTLLQ